MKKTTTTTKTPAKKQATRKPAAPAPAVPKAGPRKPRKPKLKVADTSDEHKKVSAQAESPVLQEKIAKVTPKPTPVIPEAAQLTKDQLRILNRDLPDGSMNLLKHWIDVNGVMGSDAVDLTDLLPSPKSTIKKDMLHLAELKKRLLVHTVMDQGAEWVHLTPVGTQLAAYLEELANPPPLVIDGLKDHVDKSVPAKKPAATPTAKPAAQKRVPAPKFNRAALRYDAIQRTMAAVKTDSWSKVMYEPIVASLPADFPLLYSKLKTPDKVRAYSVGIIDFCLAACRKLNTRP